MSEQLDIVVLQSPADLSGPDARLAWLRQALEAHSLCSIDLVVLPELFQCGYNIRQKLTDFAEPKDGPFAQAAADLAIKHGTAILYGYAERDGDTLYNSAQCIDTTGHRIGHHRKLLLPPGFERDHFARDNTCAVFDLKAFRLAILICYDVEFPENLRHVADLGADLVVVPTALGQEWGVVTEKVVPARAFENGVFLCYANSAGHENGMDFYGGSCVVSPTGLDLARAGSAPETLTARLELHEVAKAQKRLPYLINRKKLSATID